MGIITTHDRASAIVINNHDKWSIYQERSAQVGDGYIRWVEVANEAYIIDIQAGPGTRGQSLIKWLGATGKELHAVGVVEDAAEFWDKMEERDLIASQTDTDYLEFFGRTPRRSAPAGNAHSTEPDGAVLAPKPTQDEEGATDTVTFKRWFGASKVVDGDGKPLVVYHGTRRDFDEFVPGHPRGALGNPKGIYFTSDLRLAEEFSQDVDGAIDEKSRIVKAYLCIENDNDGIIRKNDYYGSTEYIVFDPTKIKSAIDNNGQFDPKTPDIRFSKVAVKRDVIEPTAQATVDDWFMGSKAVDAAGQPLVLYRGEHGDTNAPFQTRSSLTFSPNPETANLYAMQPNNRDDDVHSPRVIPAYLSIKTPFFNDEDPFIDLKYISQKLGSQAALDAVQAFGDAIINTSSWEENYADQFDTVEDAVAAGAQLDELYFEIYRMLDDPQWVQRIKEAGFDGAIYHGSGANALEAEYRVFEESQAKSALSSERPFAQASASNITTPFDEWFANSKVVSADGKPLVVYHGTIVRPDTDRVKSMGDINAFDRLFTTQFRGHSVDTVGSWFSTNPGEGGAEMYSGAHEGSAIYPVYLSINNPYQTTFEQMLRRARILANGEDDGRMVKQPEVDALRRWLQETGRDGIHITHNENSMSTEFKNQDAWIALEPHQIKSAVGNSGEYDPEKPDIRFSKVATRSSVSSVSASGAIANLNSIMSDAGWEIAYIDMDLTAQKPRAAMRVDRSDGRFVLAKVDALRRASFETFQRERSLKMDASTRGRRPLTPMVDDTFLGRQRFEGARSMLRSLTSYFSDNALSPVPLPDMRAAWAGVMGYSVSQSIEGTTATADKPQFATWFSGSKVVDTDGQPLVVYHGTDARFDSFNMAVAQDGAHWFTPMESHAGSFGAVRDFYISIKNPMVISQDDLDAAWDKEHPGGDQDERNLLPRDFVESFVKLAKDGGNDGLIIRNMGDRDIQSDMYLPFESGQIKSATGNNGEFDLANPDIRFSRIQDFNAIGKQNGIFYEKNGRFFGQGAVPTYDLIDNEDVVKTRIVGEHNALVELGNHLREKGLLDAFHLKNVDIRRSFAGVMAMTADTHQLAIAIGLLNMGRSPELVRQATGWSRAVDGLWRFEISDDSAAWTESYAEFAAALEPSVQLDEVLDHPALFSAYPGLRSLEVEWGDLPGTTQGTYDHLAHTITLSRHLGAKAALSVLLHEIQHGIQFIEGFARGGTAGLMAWTQPGLRAALLEQVRQGLESLQPPSYETYWGSERTAEGEAAYGAFLREWRSPEYQRKLGIAVQQGAPAKIYQSLYGEVEARNVQARQAMSPEQRMATPPAATADTEDKDVVLVFGGVVMDDAPDLSNAVLPSVKGLTDAQAVRDAIVQKLPSLVDSIDQMLERGERGEQGGLVVIESADPRDIARVYAAKTGTPLDLALKAFEVDLDEVEPFLNQDTIEGLQDIRLSALSQVDSIWQVGVGGPGKAPVEVMLQGFSDMGSGLTFMVAPNVTTASAPAVLMHEVVHAQQRDDIDAKAQALISRRAEQPAKTRAFLERVQERIDEAGDTGNVTEAMPYIVEQSVLEGRQEGFSRADGKFLRWVDKSIGAPVGNLLRDFVAVVGAAGLRFGSNKSPTVDEFVALAKMGVKATAQGRTMGGKGLRASQVLNAFNDIQESGFFSALSRGLDSIKSKAMTGTQWLDAVRGLINKGAAKQDEVEWTGLREWLALQVGSVSKERVMSYLDSNGVEVQDVVLGLTPDMIEQLQQDLSGTGYRVERSSYDGELLFVDEEGDSVGYFDLPESVQAIMDRNENQESGGQTKYEKYQLPGGKRYREVLLTLPEKKLLSADAVLAMYPEQYADINRRLLNEDNDEAAARAARREFAALRKPIQQGSLFTSPHWDDHSNVLAHMRLTDRTDAEGNKVLFVEEIQSDWGQQGKKNGFQSAAPGPAELAYREYEAGLQTRYAAFIRTELGAEIKDTVRLERMVSKFMADGDTGAMAIALDEKPLCNELARAWNAELLVDSKRLPRAPFVTTTDAWLGLAIKRIVATAADGGYDKVAFINGAQSSTRYDLSGQVDMLLFDPSESMVIGRKDGGNVITKTVADTSEIADVVGKEVAERLLASPKNGYGMHELSGLELKVGGEGMTAFYDKIVPSVLKNVLRKLGGAVELVDFGTKPDGKFGVYDGSDLLYSTDVRADADEYCSVYDGKGVVRETDLGGQQLGFAVTPALRAKVKTGLPMFSKVRRERFGASLVPDAKGEPLVMYHGTKSAITEFDPTKTVDGAFHFGTLEQARMRASGPDAKHVAVHVSARNLRRSRDTGGQWKSKIASAKSAGYDGIVYLNRYEGISTETVLKAHEQGIDLDRLSDAQFRRFAPEARDSYIAFDPRQIQMVAVPQASADAKAVASRMEALPALQKSAGAAYTLWQVATKAIGKVQDIDWRNIHKEVIAQSIGKNRQSPAAVGDVLCKHSPGAVDVDQQAAVRQDVDAYVQATQAGLQKALSDNPKRSVGVKVFQSTAHKDAVYGAMLERIDCGPFDGGCVVFAQALQAVYGGEVYVIDGEAAQSPTGPLTSKGAQHAILRLPNGRFMDASGEGSERTLVSRLNRTECFGSLVRATARPLRDGDLPEAPRNGALVDALAKLLQHDPYKARETHSNIEISH